MAPSQKSLITIRKQQVVLYTVLGPIITLLLGILIGIGFVEEPSTDVTNTVLEITASNIKEHFKYTSSVILASKGEETFAKEIAEKWESLLDKVMLVPFEANGKISYNVIGYLMGTVEKERFIILGGHRTLRKSGTPLLMELARSFGQLAKSGEWRPRRTIVFCSWAQEREGVSGSTKWEIAMEKILLYKAVVYFDVDHPIEGSASLSASGTPNLKSTVFEAAQKVANPIMNEIAAGRSSVFDTWLHRTPDKHRPGLPVFETPQSKNRNWMILFRTGVPVLGFGYGGTTHGKDFAQTPEHDIESYDPGYKFSVAVTQIWAELTRKFADEVILPFSPFEYIYTLDEMVSKMLVESSQIFQDHSIHTEHLSKMLKKFDTSATKLEKLIKNTDQNDDARVRVINDKLFHFERIFLDMIGLFDKPEHRHILFGMEDLDCPKCHELPGVKSAISLAKRTGNWNEVARQISILTFHIDAAATTLSEIW